MRTNELLAALAQEGRGVKVYVNTSFSFCVLLYPPFICCHGKTPFNAAFAVAMELLVHPDCPLPVLEALEEYEAHTENLGL